MTGDVLARVLGCVDDLEESLVTTAAHLVRCPSVSGTDGENEAQAEMAALLTAGGLDVDHWPIDLASIIDDPAFPGMEVPRSEAWGLVGRLPGAGDGPCLMLNGHVDVVPTGDPAAWTDPPFEAVIRGGRLHGRGACDMKAGLVAAHVAVQAVRRSGMRLRGDVLVASVQGEEDGGLGTFATLRRGWTADACVIPEPTDLAVIPANSGALTFRLLVHGRATHAARRTDGVSAIDKFGPIAEALRDLEQSRHRHVDPLMSRWELAHPLSIGTIRSGDWASSVPDLLVAEGRIGVALDEPVEETRRQLEQAVEETCGRDPWLREHPVEVEWWGGQFESGRTPADSDLIERVRAAHDVAGGSSLDVYGAPYGSDLRLLTGLGGIATVQYGPGDAELAHGPRESVEIAQVVAAARTLAVLIVDVCGVV